MQILKKIFILLLSFLLLVVLIGLMLPSQTIVSRSAQINKPVAVPFKLVNHLPSWTLWSPWYFMDTTAEIIYSNPDEGIGAFYTWTSNHPDVGSGKLIIENGATNEFIDITLLFNKWGNSNTRFEFEQIDEKTTKLTWSIASQHGWNIISRWMGLFLDRMIGKDFEQGLAKITEVAESTVEKELVGGFESEFREINTVKLLSLRYQLAPQKVSSALFSKSFSALLDVAIQTNIELDGMPMVVYYEIAPKRLDFEAAVPIKTDFVPKGKFIVHELQGGKALVITYRGAYDQMSPVYIAAYQYLENNNMALNGPIREVYITDPQEEKDTANWITEIVFPVQ
jgi:effector-binding domain-containing protein